MVHNRAGRVSRGVGRGLKYFCFGAETSTKLGNKSLRPKMWNQILGLGRFFALNCSCNRGPLKISTSRNSLPIQLKRESLKVARLQSEFCTKDFLVRATNFLTKNAPIFSPKILSLCSVGQKNPGKIPPNFPNFPAKNKKNSPTSLCRSAGGRITRAIPVRRGFDNFVKFFPSFFWIQVICSGRNQGKATHPKTTHSNRSTLRKLFSLFSAYFKGKRGDSSYKLFRNCLRKCAFVWVGVFFWGGSPLHRRKGRKFTLELLAFQRSLKTLLLAKGRFVEDR